LVDDGDDAAAVDADVLPRWLGHVEVGARRAAPAAVGERVVGWAQVGGGDGDGVAGLAPHGLGGVTLDGVALATGGAVVEQHLAQRGVEHSIARVVQVVVAARATCICMRRWRTMSSSKTNVTVSISNKLIKLAAARLALAAWKSGPTYVPMVPEPSAPP